MLDINKLKEEQTKLSKKIMLKDALKIEDIKTIGGVNQVVIHNEIFSSIVVCDYKTMEVVEKQDSIEKTRIPYLSGFRAYREGPAITSEYAKLSTKPDVLIFLGNGILHPRNIGLASHIGLLLDQPSIGMAKSLACGTIEGNKVKLDNKIVGAVVETKKHSRPVYVSPGHKITLKTSIEIVKSCMRPPHKLPEPLHLAYRYSKELAKKE